MSCNLNAQFNHQRYGHVFHLCIIQMSKLGIYSGQLKSIPNLSHPSCACITSEGPLFTHNLNVSTYNLDPGNNFHPYFSFFNKVSCQKIISALTIVAATTITSLDIPPDQSIHHSNSSRNSFISSATIDTRAPYSRLMKEDNFPDQQM